MIQDWDPFCTILLILNDCSNVGWPQYFYVPLVGVTEHIENCTTIIHCNTIVDVIIL